VGLLIVYMRSVMGAELVGRSNLREKDRVETSLCDAGRRCCKMGQRDGTVHVLGALIVPTLGFFLGYALAVRMRAVACKILL
jgi:hypothetical protein